MPKPIPAAAGAAAVVPKDASGAVAVAGAEISGGAVAGGAVASGCATAGGVAAGGRTENASPMRATTRAFTSAVVAAPKRVSLTPSTTRRTARSRRASSCRALTRNNSSTPSRARRAAAEVASRVPPPPEAMAALGMTAAEIAAEMEIALGTVRVHLRAVYERLGVTNRAELCRALQTS